MRKKQTNIRCDLFSIFRWFHHTLAQICGSNVSMQLNRLWFSKRKITKRFSPSFCRYVSTWFWKNINVFHLLKNVMEIMFGFILNGRKVSWNKRWMFCSIAALIWAHNKRFDLHRSKALITFELMRSSFSKLYAQIILFVATLIPCRKKNYFFFLIFRSNICSYECEIVRISVVRRCYRAGNSKKKRS